MKRDLLVAYIALAAICIIWGTTYLALRIAVLHFPPFLFIAIRQTIAGLILIGIMMTFYKAQWPSIDQLIIQSIAGFFMISLGNGLVAWGEMYISSSLAAIICSLMPILIILINLTVNRQEKPTMSIVLGVIMGLAGIIMIFGEDITVASKTHYILGIIMTFTAVLAWSACSVWLKKQNIITSNTFLNAGLQMFFGGFWLFPFSLLFDDLSNVNWSPEAAYSLLYLILFGSIIAYACYSYVLKKLPMTIVSMYAYINPIVAVILGWLVLDEKLNLKIAIAIFITLGGIYIVNRGYRLKVMLKSRFPLRRVNR
jgi:drug/metabolite transporter (DMT)-like permease